MTLWLTQCPVLLDTFAPAASTTLPQRTSSLLMNAPSSSGVLVSGRKPSSKNRFCVSCDFTTSSKAWFSRATIAGGVPAGARTPARRSRCSS